MSENEKGKSEKVKLTLSVHQVVNYTQEVELYPWEIRHLESNIDSDLSREMTEKIVKKQIDSSKIYSREEILQCDILEKEEV